MNQSELTLMAIKAFLAGFSKTQFVDQAIIRGSFVTRSYMGEFARECKDLDLLYLNKYSKDKIKELLIESIHKANDSVTFQLDTLVLEEIWKLSISPGLRATIEYVYSDFKGELQIDVAANDPLSEGPVSFTVDLNKDEKVIVNTVGLETAVAWKFHGLFENLNGAWMSKTLWDLYVLCKENTLDKRKLKSAINLAFSSRLDPLDITKRFFWGDFAKSKTSRRYWKKDVLEIVGAEQYLLINILAWLREYLLDIVNLKNDGSLLTHSEVITYRVKELRRLNSDDAIAKLKTLNHKTRILKTKAYGSIPHLPGSRLGLSERTIDLNKVRMLTLKSVNELDKVIVQEKLDGSCVCAYRRGDEILALGREGDLASESPNYSRQLWSDWVEENKDRFLDLLNEEERVCGEWMALVHGTRYKLNHEPFVAFDLFDGNNRPICFEKLKQRCDYVGFKTPLIVHQGNPISIECALKKLDFTVHGAIDKSEGLVFRLEREGRLLFRAKYVDLDKIDGCFLTENTGKPEMWNWHPNLDNKLHI